ncbi:MAG: hypothetical protein ABMA26_21805 [Limisphaerales bacterium]
MKPAITPHAGLVLALLLGGCVGTQRHPDPDMVGTKRVIAMSQPSEQATPHQLQRLHAAFVRDDGTILLQIHGKPVKEAKTQPCTLEIPPPKRPSQINALARRVEVPTSALHLGWDAALLTATNVHPLPIGPVMTIQAEDAYVWDAITLPEGRAQEIRLVQRLGTVSQWEILLLRAQPTAAQARFTIFEVRPTMVPVNNRAALALMPFALAEDVMTNVGTPVAKAAFIPAVGIAIFYGSWASLNAACEILLEGTKSLGRAIGLVKEESSP